MDAQALGRYLRETREAKELTLDDAERALRIRRRILESFELGEFTLRDASSVQVRGFIRNYARYLGLEEERVVQYYEAARQEALRPRKRSSGKRRSKRETQPFAPVAARSITDTNPSLPAVPIVMVENDRRRGSWLSTLVMMLVALAALAVIVLVAVELIGQPDPNLQPDTPDILAQLPASPSFTPAPTATFGPTLTPIAGLQQNFSGEGVMVTVEMEQRSWIRLAVDGVEQYAGIAPPGTVIEYQGNDSISLTASNAEALRVIYNGQPQNTFGGRGQKVDIVFRRNSVEISSGPGFEPTSEFSPTPLPTSDINVGATLLALTPSNTPGPSPTPSDTPTITLTPSITPTASDTPTPSDTPTITPTPTLTPTPSDTPTATYTPSPTRTPTITLTPTNTLTPTPTAILPPRVTQEGLPPTKPSGS